MKRIVRGKVRVRDRDFIAATEKLDRNTRRLLRDLTGLGRVEADRTPARERLEAELGDPLCRSLLDAGEATADRLGPSQAA